MSHPSSDSDFNDKLYTFLTSQYGRHYSRYIRLNSTTPPVRIKVYMSAIVWMSTVIFVYISIN